MRNRCDMPNDTNGTKKGPRSRQVNQSNDQSLDEATNRYIVLFRDAESGIKQLQTTAGLQANLPGAGVPEALKL